MSKIMKIKIIVLIFSFSFLCFGESALEELVDKCDFVNFNSEYQLADLSEQEKTKLLVRVDQIINKQKKDLKSFFGLDTPPLKCAKSLRWVPPLYKITGIIAGAESLFFGLLAIKSFISVKTASGYAKERKAYNDIENYNKALNLRDEYKSLLYKEMGMSILTLSATTFCYLACKYIEKNLIEYNQYKKALKIKTLIEETLLSHSEDKTVDMVG